LNRHRESFKRWEQNMRSHQQINVISVVVAAALSLAGVQVWAQSRSGSDRGANSQRGSGLSRSDQMRGLSNSRWHKGRSISSTGNLESGRTLRVEPWLTTPGGEGAGQSAQGAGGYGDRGTARQQRGTTGRINEGAGANAASRDDAARMGNRTFRNDAMTDSGVEAARQQPGVAGQLGMGQTGQAGAGAISPGGAGVGQQGTGAIGQRGIGTRNFAYRFGDSSLGSGTVGSYSGGRGYSTDVPGTAGQFGPSTPYRSQSGIYGYDTGRSGTGTYGTGQYGTGAYRQGVTGRYAAPADGYGYYSERRYSQMYGDRQVGRGQYGGAYRQPDVRGVYGYRSDDTWRGTAQRDWRYDTQRHTDAYSDWYRNRQDSTRRGTDWYGRSWDRDTGDDMRGYVYNRSPFDQNGGPFGIRR